MVARMVARMLDTPHERRRLAAVRELAVMDNVFHQEAYDQIARLAQRLFGVDIVLITFIDEYRQWFKSHLGSSVTEFSRDENFFTDLLNFHETTVIEDTALDERFARCPLVLGKTHIRLYASEPLVTQDGYAIGTVCIADRLPRVFKSDDAAVLQDLADLVMTRVKLDTGLNYGDSPTKVSSRVQFSIDFHTLPQRLAKPGHWAAVVELLGLPEATEAMRALGVTYVHDQLTHAASVIKSILPYETIYHVGTVHLALFLPATANAFSQLDEVIAALRLPFMTAAGIPAQLEPGCGVRQIAGDEKDFPDILRTLYFAAKEAREMPRGVALYNRRNDAAFQRSYSLVTAVPKAITEDEFFLVFQPRFEARSGRCAGVEALLRWAHPQLGLISPAEFIPLVTTTGMRRDLTDWVMRHVCKQMSEWFDAGLHLHCSFNVGATNLEEDDFVDRLSALVRRCSIGPETLEIELTEDIALTGNSAVLERLTALRALGVGVAIDDFGSGYSNLAYLLELPASVLKLDRSLVKNALLKPSHGTAITSIVTMGHSLGYRIVAEGVDTPELATSLAAWGCDELQGYALKEPLSSFELTEWILSSSSEWRLSSAHD